jgi:hypothetical protein
MTLELVDDIEDPGDSDNIKFRYEIKELEALGVTNRFLEVIVTKAGLTDSGESAPWGSRVATCAVELLTGNAEGFVVSATLTT